MTGKRTGLAATVRRAVRSLSASGIPYCVIGATALAVRGLPRMSRDLDVTVLLDDAEAAWAALRAAGLEATTPTGSPEDPEAMVVWTDPRTGVGVDLRVAAGDPEAAAIDEATLAEVFGVQGRVATIEHLLLLYLYSNQPKHLGDFASIVRSGLADVGAAERKLALMHTEMLSAWSERLHAVRHPQPSPPRPGPRKRRRPPGT
jgi:hypothetical protein